MITLQAFGDESSDERCERHFLIAVLYGRASVWRSAESKWKKVTKGRVFHLRERASRDLVPLLKPVLVQSGLVGLVVGVDLQALRKHLPHAPKDLHYSKCFSELIAGGANALSRANQGVPARHQAKLEFVFDNRPKTEVAAKRLYERIVKHVAYPKGLSSEVSFDSRHNPRIQMADLFAGIANDHIAEGKPIELPHYRLVWLDDSRCRDLSEKVTNGQDPYLDSLRKWLLKKKKVQNTKSGALSFHDTLLNRALHDEDSEHRS